MKFDNLFKPIKIGSTEIKNRIAMSPMNVHMSSGDGFVTDQDMAFHVARAKGGVGLNFLACVLSSARAGETHDMLILHLFSKRHARGMRDLAQAVQAAGAKIFVQLSPGFGRQGRATWSDIWSASNVPMDYLLMYSNLPKTLGAYTKYIPIPKGKVTLPRPMTKQEIIEEEDNFVKAAELAALCSFDGVEVHSPHGYLLHQFLSPRTNKRDDEYGGSLENRARFLTNIISKVKKELGKDMPLSVRLSGAEHVEGGFTAEDTREVAKLCVEAGVDCINLSDGCYENLRYFFPEQDNAHILEEQGAKLRAAVKVPIISFSINDPAMADKAIADGETDMIGLGRQLLADPEWPNKVKKGKIEDIVRCDRDNFCNFTLQTEGTINCIHNPNLGRERFMPEYWPKKITNKVPETLKKLHLGEKLHG